MVKKVEKEKKPKKKPAKKEPGEEKENFRGIVRIAGKDVKGQKKLLNSLLHVKGIGHSVAVSASKAIERELKIDPNIPVGELTEKQVEDIDKILFDLKSYNVPRFMLNRRGDFNTGTDRHVIMNDLIFDMSQDVDREKKLFSWKGFRHTFGQKVRGQKTRNTGRHGMAVGVLRKSIIAATGAKKPEAKK
ncbi:30S ribosomal protein S13 [Candidatus Micrarchaeota archaeon]|nr:30S ribosomal protein S13 [Candidatus Micrarchaeota archaeon]